MTYVHLTHGRTSPDEQLTDWGREGPCLGPFRWVHFTYLVDLHAEDESGDACQFEVVAGLIYYDGVYYGDVTLQSEPQRGSTEPEKFDAAKARR